MLTITLFCGKIPLTFTAAAFTGAFLLILDIRMYIGFYFDISMCNLRGFWRYTSRGIWKQKCKENG